MKLNFKNTTLVCEDGELLVTTQSEEKIIFVDKKYQFLDWDTKFFGYGVTSLLSDKFISQSELEDTYRIKEAKSKSSLLVC